MWDRFQIYGDANWIPQYPDPSSYLPSFFGCGGATSNGYYCNPAIDQEMQRAQLLEPTNRRNQARVGSPRPAADQRRGWVPTIASREVELTSGRLRTTKSTRGLDRRRHAAP